MAPDHRAHSFLTAPRCSAATEHHLGAVGLPPPRRCRTPPPKRRGPPPGVASALRVTSPVSPPVATIAAMTRRPSSPSSPTSACATRPRRSARPSSSTSAQTPRSSTCAHDVRKYAIGEGALSLWGALPVRAGRVHVAVVDPGRGHGPPAGRAAGRARRRADRAGQRPARARRPSAWAGSSRPASSRTPAIGCRVVTVDLPRPRRVRTRSRAPRGGAPFESLGRRSTRRRSSPSPLAGAAAVDGGLDAEIVYVDTFGNAEAVRARWTRSGPRRAAPLGRRFRVTLGDGRVHVIPWSPTFGERRGRASRCCTRTRTGGPASGSTRARRRRAGARRAGRRLQLRRRLIGRRVARYTPPGTTSGGDQTTSCAPSRASAPSPSSPSSPRPAPAAPRRRPPAPTAAPQRRPPSRPPRPSEAPSQAAVACTPGTPDAQDRRHAHHRRRQPGLSAVLPAVRPATPTVGARRPDQRPRLRERRRPTPSPRNLGFATDDRHLGRRCRSTTRSSRARRTSTST